VVGLEADHLPLQGGGRHRVDGAAVDVGEPLELARLAIELVDVVDPILAVRGEVEPLAVLRERRALVVAGPERQLLALARSASEIATSLP
jgi:hypothetical protein